MKKEVNKMVFCLNGGFTLIELLVVVLIIGILAAVAVPQYQVAVEKSRLATLKHLTEAVAKAQEVYYLGNSQYATKLSELDVELPGGGEVNEDDNTITYGWGKCTILDPNCVACVNTLKDEEMKYIANYIHSIFHGERHCQTLNTTGLGTVRNKVCKSDTGTTGTRPMYETASGKKYITWHY